MICPTENSLQYDFQYSDTLHSNEPLNPDEFQKISAHPYFILIKTNPNVDLVGVCNENVRLKGVQLYKMTTL